MELAGSFNCSCYPGYELQEDKVNCAGNNRYRYNYLATYVYSTILQSDIDECTQGLAGCSYNCINTLGSFLCTCMNGFELLSDNRNCGGNQYNMTHS